MHIYFGILLQRRQQSRNASGKTRSPRQQNLTLERQEDVRRRALAYRVSPTTVERDRRAGWLATSPTKSQRLRTLSGAT